MSQEKDGKSRKITHGGIKGRMAWGNEGKCEGDAREMQGRCKGGEARYG